LNKLQQVGLYLFLPVHIVALGVDNGESLGDNHKLRVAVGVSKARNRAKAFFGCLIYPQHERVPLFQAEVLLLHPKSPREKRERTRSCDEKGTETIKKAHSKRGTKTPRNSNHWPKLSGVVAG
jgi:hypothetical protein